MKNLAIIPARSGSKGLKDKNIKNLNGKPLMSYTIEAAEKSGLFDEIMVSTNSQEYADIAKSCGANIPFMRTEDLSNDSASTWDVVKDVIDKYKKLGKEFDIVAILQPTSPLRTYEDIREGFRLMVEKSANFVVSVCEVDHSPLWANTLPEDNSMNNFIRPDILSNTRQNIPIYYRINGAIYVIKVDYLMQSINPYSKGSYATIMSKEHSIDIDDQLDFTIAEVLLNKKI